MTELALEMLRKLLSERNLHRTDSLFSPLGPVAQTSALSLIVLDIPVPTCPAICSPIPWLLHSHTNRRLPTSIPPRVLVFLLPFALEQRLQDYSLGKQNKSNYHVIGKAGLLYKKKRFIQLTCLGINVVFLLMLQFSTSGL